MATVEFNISQDWGSGFEGEITLVNDGSLTYENWELEFTADFEITSIWNADIVSQEGNRYVIRYKDWNPDLDIGETITFGFNGSPLNNQIGEPTDYLLNGQSLDTENPTPTLPTLTVDVDNVSITEGDDGVSFINYTFNLSQASSEDVSVDYMTIDGTAIAGEDYQAVVDTLTISAGETSKTISVAINGDQEIENDETFSLNLNNPVGVSIANDQVVTTIVNDDQSDTVTPPVSNNGIVVDFMVDSQWETGFSGTIKLTNQGDIALDDWEIQFDSLFEITSIWDAQIENSNNGNYTIADVGWNANINPDQTISFGFNGSYDGAGAVPPPTNYVVNGELLGNYPSISIDDVTVTETDNENSSVTFTVSLSESSEDTVTVDYQTGDGTASEGSDYFGVMDTLVFSPNETTKTITVDIAPDTVYEGNENFFLNLSNSTQANIADNQGVATIVENDLMPPSLSIDDVSVIEGNEGVTDAIFTVSLSRSFGETVTVNYETGDGTAIAGSDYESAMGNLTFNPGETTKTINIGVNGDITPEGNQSFFVNLSDPTNAIFSDDQGRGIITNDDQGGNSEIDYVVGAYYPEWAIYDRDFQVEDIPADKLTHVFYAFAKIDDNGEVAIFDEWAATQTTFGGKYTWEESERGEAGNLAELQALKEENPHLRNMISIGGWTLSDSFSDVALTDASREKFASSAVEFMIKYDFDGIDVDWEYPVGGGLASNTYRPEDKENYTLLLGELREQMDAQSAIDGEEYELTIAAPAGDDKIVNYDLVGMSEHLDFINVMTYDYHGSWEKQTNHQAALYANPDDPSELKDTYNIDSTIQQYLDAGVPAEDLVLGAPIYGRSWTGVGDANDGLFQSATGAGPGTWEAGIFDYKELYEKVNDPNSGYDLFWDDTAQVPYVYNESLGVFSTYEDSRSLGMKLDYLQEQGLGGMFFWEASADLNANHPDSLINIAATELAVVV